MPTEPAPPLPPRNGTIIVTITTSGEVPDSDGYRLTVDRALSRHVPANARETFESLPAGQRVVELLSVAHNCITSSGSTRVVALTEGAIVEVNYSVYCRPPSDTGDVFVGAAGMYDLFIPNHGSITSQYVLYDDGAFSLQFFSARFGFFEYPGRYVRRDSVISFAYDGWSVAGPWLATGILRGDSLTVNYNEVMMWTDFIDGVYVRSR